MKNIIVLILLLGTGLPSFADEPVSLRNESEAGMVITTGNTAISTLNFKQANVLASGPNFYLLNANFLRSSNGGIQQALQWGLGLRFEHELTQRHGIFIGQLVESNIYQNIFQRYATDTGVKYFFL